MNSTISKTLVSSAQIDPLVTSGLKAHLNFMIWVEKDFDVYNGVIESIEQSSFHVVAIRSSLNIKYDLAHVQQSISSAKASDKNVALFFNEIHLYEPEHLRFLMETICNKNIGGVQLGQQDVILATATAILDSRGCDVLRHSIPLPILNRMCHFTLE